MLTALKALFKKDTPDQKAPRSTEQPHTDEDVQLAFAALLAEAARVDEDYDDTEKKLITSLLQKQFELTETQAVELRVRGEEAQQNAIDLHQFTREVKTLPQDERIAFIEGLWLIVFSDGVRDPYEDTLIRQICSLIHLTDRESNEARRRAEKAG